MLAVEATFSGCRTISCVRAAANRLRCGLRCCPVCAVGVEERHAPGAFVVLKQHDPQLMCAQRRHPPRPRRQQRLGLHDHHAVLPPAHLCAWVSGGVARQRRSSDNGTCCCDAQPGPKRTAIRAKIIGAGLRRVRGRGHIQCDRRCAAEPHRFGEIKLALHNSSEWPTAVCAARQVCRIVIVTQHREPWRRRRFDRAGGRRHRNARRASD